MDTKEQHERYENARKRVKQKKRLYYHFVLFLVGSVFLIVINKVLNFGESFLKDWFVWAIFAGAFFWVLHFINVFVTNRFMGKDWERTQTEKLILKQEVKIAQLEKKVAKEHPLKPESSPHTPALKNKENPPLEQASE
ncbi:MAG: 2TM domain-containing protein [Flavobacteriaceae bacterium]|nr:2TM domain-containing protein [Flavobacteriaceae bacterium]